MYVSLGKSESIICRMCGLKSYLVKYNFYLREGKPEIYNFATNTLLLKIPKTRYAYKSH